MDPEALLPLKDAFPDDLACGARMITDHARSLLPDFGDADYLLCANIILATWAHELDKAGKLDIGHRLVAYIYQAGRIAAQQLRPDLAPRVATAVEWIVNRRW